MSVIGEIKAVLTMDTTGMEQATKKADRTLDDLIATMEQTRTAITVLAEVTGKLAATLSGVGKSVTLDAVRQEVTGTAATVTDLGGALTKVGESLNPAPVEKAAADMQAALAGASDGLNPAPIEAAAATITDALAGASGALDPAQIQKDAAGITTALKPTEAEAAKLAEALKKPGEAPRSWGGVKAALDGLKGWLKGVEEQYTRTRDAQGRFEKGAGGIGETLAGIGKNALSFAGGLGIFNGITEAIKGVASAGIGWNASLEVSRSKWETLLGSTQKAQEQLKWMADFAAATPFEFAELDTAASRLKAFGFTIEQTRSLLGTLGDTAAATGKGSVALDALANSLGKIEGTGKVTTEALNMMSDQGINGFKILAEGMGVTEAKIRSMIEQGIVPAGKAIPLLAKGLDHAFGGAMAKQAETFIGKISTLKDNVRMLLGDAFKPAFGWLSGTALPFAIGLIDKLTAGFKQGGLMGAIRAAFGADVATLVHNVTGGVKVLFDTIMLVAQTAAPALKTGLGGVGLVLSATFGWIAEHGDLVKAIILGIAGAWAVFTARQLYFTGVAKLAAAAQWALNVAMNANPVGLVIIAIAALIAIGYLLVKNWDTVKRFALDAWGGIKAFVYDAIASLIGYYAKFIGIFSAGKAAEAQAVVASLRTQASAEREIVQVRNDGAAEEAAARAGAERIKAEAAAGSADAQIAAVQGVGAATADVWAGMAGAVDDSTGKQKKAVQDYLDAFTTAFDRAQQDAMTGFERQQEVELTAFQRGQADKMTELERFQTQEKDALKASQAAKLKNFEASLADEKIAYQRELDDILAAQDETWKAEATAFKRAQEDQLDAFKSRMDEEKRALKQRQDDELAANDKVYAARKKAIQDQIDAIKDQEKAQQNASKIGDLKKNVGSAKDDVKRAEMTGSSVDIFRAKEKLAAAEKALQDEQAKQARDARVDSLGDQLKSLDEEARQKQDALKKTHAAETLALDQSLAEKLKARQRELDDDATHFGLKQDLAKAAFKRMQADELEAFGKAQDQRLENFKKDQDAETKRLDERQAWVKETVKRMQDDELTAYKHHQDHLKEQYKRETEDLKDSLKQKLDAQRQYLNDLKKLQADLAPTAADGSPGPALPAPNVPKFARGAVARKPTLGIFGEAGPEAITPLDWLLSTIRGVARDVAIRVAAVTSPTGGSGQGSGAGAAQGAMDQQQQAPSTQTIIQVAPGAVVIPAKDLAEMRTVQEFFDRIQQTARAISGEA